MHIHNPSVIMEVKLWNHDKREREMYDNFDELYAIVKASEKVEKAYFVRDIISSKEKEYELDCQKLIAHFNNLASTKKETATMELTASASTSAAIVAVCVLKLNMVAVDHDQVHPKMGT